MVPMMISEARLAGVPTDANYASVMACRAAGWGWPGIARLAFVRWLVASGRLTR